MRTVKLCKILVIGLVIGLSFVSSTLSILHASDEPYVLVTLRDDSVLKFKSDSFTLHWVVPEVKDELSCDVTSFNPIEVDEVYILNTADNFCDKRNSDWLFDIYIKNGRAIRGFIDVTEENVTGKLFESGEEKTIPFLEVKKVNFK